MSRRYILIGFDGDPPTSWQDWLVEHITETDELQLCLTGGELADFSRKLLIMSEMVDDA